MYQTQKLNYRNGVILNVDQYQDICFMRNLRKFVHYLHPLLEGSSSHSSFSFFSSHSSACKHRRRWRQCWPCWWRGPRPQSTRCWSQSSHQHLWSAILCYSNIGDAECWHFALSNTSPVLQILRFLSGIEWKGQILSCQFNKGSRNILGKNSS